MFLLLADVTVVVVVGQVVRATSQVRSKRGGLLLLYEPMKRGGGQEVLYINRTGSRIQCKRNYIIDCPKKSESESVVFVRVSRGNSLAPKPLSIPQRIRRRVYRTSDLLRRTFAAFLIFQIHSTRYYYQ